MQETQEEICAHVMSANLAYFTTEKQGSLTNALVTESNKAANVFVTLGQWMAGIVACFLYVILVLSVSGWLALVAAVFGILCLWPLRYIPKRASDYGRVWTRLNEEAQVFFP